MFTRIRWMLIAIGGLVLVTGGISIFSIPDHEVLYDARPPLVTCMTSGCVSIYTLEVGNTGREMQDDVRVRLRRDAIREPILPPSVRTFGKVDRRVGVRDEDDVRIYDLGPVRPQERIELQLVYQDHDRSARRDWQRMLVSVEAAQGEARRGNPGGVLLGRLLYAIFASGCA
jgi:hypothetical protein